MMVEDWLGLAARSYCHSNKWLTTTQFQIMYPNPNHLLEYNKPNRPSAQGQELSWFILLFLQFFKNNSIVTVGKGI